MGDEEAERYIKIFTDLPKDEIEALIEEHRQDPGRRILQKRLGQEVTVLVHGQADYEMAVEATNILFGKATKKVCSSSTKRLFSLFSTACRSLR